MSLILILILCGGLLLLVVGYSLIQQQKERVEAERKIEVQRQRAIISETEAVLANTGMAPCSSNMLLILYKRMKNAVEESIPNLPQQSLADYQRRLSDLNTQINTMSSAEPQVPAVESFRLPDNDRNVLELVKTLKLLKSILRAEHGRGKIDPILFAEEESRIDQLQLRINVDSMISRARSACSLKQYGSSKQMVTKALNTLHAIKAKTPNDPFITRKVDEAKQLLDEIMGEQRSAQPEVAPQKNEGSELDSLFQPKKKW